MRFLRTLLCIATLIGLAAPVDAQQSGTRSGPSASPSSIYYTPGGAAVSRSLQSKLADVVSIKDFGAKCDGTTNDTTAIQAAVNAGVAFVPPTSSACPVTSLSIPAGSGLVGVGLASKITVSSSNGIAIAGSNVKLDRVNITAVSGNAQLIYAGASSVTDVSITNSRIDASAAATAIQINQTGALRWRLTNSYIYGLTYGVLVNTSATGGELIISGNSITSYQADAIELNTTSGTFKNTVITGNTIAALNNDGGAGSGFAIGVAKSDGLTIVGNVITESRREAIHVEDAQRNLVIADNVVRGARMNGIHVINLSGAEPPVITGNQVMSYSNDGSTGTGIFFVYDGSGSIPRANVSNNRVVGFGTGFYGGFGSVVALGGTIIEGCPTALAGAGFNRFSGTVIVKGATTVGASFAFGNTTVGPLIFTDAKPTTLVEKTTAGSYPGVTLEGFEFPLTAAHAGGGATVQNVLFTMPHRVRGELRIEAGDADANSAVRDARVLWDGSTLTESDAVTLNNGTHTQAAFNVSSNNMRFPLTVSGGAITETYRVIFRGMFHTQ